MLNLVETHENLVAVPSYHYQPVFAQAVRAAIGSGVDVERFAIEAFQAHGATVSRNGDVKFDVKEVPRGLLE